MASSAPSTRIFLRCLAVSGWIFAGSAIAQEAPPQDPASADTEPPLISRASVADIQASITTPLQISPEGPTWYRNPWDALELSRQSQRPLLLLFTSSQDGRCQLLSSQVFATKSFSEYAKSSLVICFLDYPRNITQAPDWMRRIKERYKVKGYPNLLLLNPKGQVARQITGYRENRPVDYFTELKSTAGPLISSLQSRRKSLIDQGFRDWASPGGVPVFARVEKRNESFVRLLDADGQPITVDLGQFTEEDRTLILTFPAVEPEPPPEAAETR